MSKIKDILTSGILIFPGMSALGLVLIFGSNGMDVRPVAIIAGAIMFIAPLYMLYSLIKKEIV